MPNVNVPSLGAVFPLSVHRRLISLLRLLTVTIALATLIIMYMSPTGRLLRATRDPVKLVRDRAGEKEWGGKKFRFDHKDGFIGYAEGSNFVEVIDPPTLKAKADPRKDDIAVPIAQPPGRWGAEKKLDPPVNYLVVAPPEFKKHAGHDGWAGPKPDGLTTLLGPDYTEDPEPKQAKTEIAEPEIRLSLPISDDEPTTPYPDFSPRAGIFGSGGDSARKACRWLSMIQSKTLTTTVSIPAITIETDPWGNYINCPPVTPTAKNPDTGNYRLGGLFPFLTEIYGGSIPVPPQLEQLLRGLDTSREYLDMASSPKTARYTLRDISIDPQTFRFSLLERFFDSDGLGNLHGAGGSSFHAQITLTSCDVAAPTLVESEGDDNSRGSEVLEATAMCEVSDRYDGQYDFYCPIETGMSLLLHGGAKGLVFRLDLSLLYTHFRGVRSSLGFSEQPHNIPIASDLVVGHVDGLPVLEGGEDSSGNQQRWYEGGHDLRPTCTEGEITEGSHGGVWMRLEKEVGVGRWRWLHNAECSLASMVTPTRKTDPLGFVSTLNKPLLQCANSLADFSFYGASHVRYQFDQFAHELGVRNEYLDMHHGSYQYLKSKLRYYDLKFYRDIEMVLDKWNRTGGNPVEKENSFAFFQAGAWNVAACDIPSNIHDMDRMFRKLLGLVQASKGTVVWLSTPPFPRNPARENNLMKHRHMRKNPILYAMEQLNELYISAINEIVRRKQTENSNAGGKTPVGRREVGKNTGFDEWKSGKGEGGAATGGVVYVDYYSIARPRAEDSVCMDHYNCPDGRHMLGEVGMEVTNVLANIMCQPGRE
eukprot:comp22174_c0_seq1/m.32552 comp22174_c0_seq1/g.32552  ORF comp22174_c0_seq1/g.32552 comp22174_c0_seq1/m.32552 type:complete len:817 (-) comp22174_c0_seq1:93-2543(-)